MLTIEEAKRMEVAVDGLGQAIDAILRQELGNVGFALLIFNYGECSIGNYISNAAREDVIKVFRRSADRLESQQNVPLTIGSIQ